LDTLQPNVLKIDSWQVSTFPNSVEQNSRTPSHYFSSESACMGFKAIKISKQRLPTMPFKHLNLVTLVRLNIDSKNSNYRVLFLSSTNVNDKQKSKLT